MNAAGFAARFRSRISPSLNWDRLLAEQWPVTITSLNDLAQIEELGLPWYVREDRSATVGLDDTACRRVYVKEIPELVSTILGGLGEHIEQRLKEFRANAPVSISAPCYEAAGRPRILLDGCHSCSAIMLGRLNIPLELAIVHGPNQYDCLADLAGRD